MRKSKYPRLRSKVYKGRGGQVWTYFLYDMRGTGKPDIRLGTDYAAAIQQWERLHNHLPPTLGTVQEAIDRWREECLPEYENPNTRRNYAMHLARIEKLFGKAGWHEVKLPDLRRYLDGRKAKVQANRELAVLSIVWGRARLWGMTELHWPAAGVKDWKNPEQARQFEVTDELFQAVWDAGDRVLRDCMDIASATGMRLTDARTIRMPQDGRLRFRASKTGKWAYFEVSESPVLSALVQRREAMRADSVMLLVTDTGLQVSARMLRTRYDDARAKAMKANPGLAEDIRAMYLRDMRKRAADLSSDVDGAAKLLQHTSTAVTKRHYRSKATKLVAVR